VYGAIIGYREANFTCSNHDMLSILWILRANRG
jgi:hypothetical protein